MRKSGKEMTAKKQNSRQMLKKSPLLTGLPFLHATLLLAPVPAFLYALLGAGDEELLRLYWLGGLVIFPVVLSWLAVRHLQALWLYALSGVAAVILAALAAPMAGETVSLIFGQPFSEDSSATLQRFSMAGKLTAGGLTAFLWLVRGAARIRRGKLRREFMEMPVGEGSAQMPELPEIPMFLDEPRSVQFAFFAVFYLASLPLGHGSLYRYIFGLLFADILVCFLYRYLNSFREYVEEHQSIANLPVQTMRKIIRLLLLPAVLVLLLAMAPALLYGDEPLTRLRIDLSGKGPAPVEFRQPPAQESQEMNEILSQLMDGEVRQVPAWVHTLLELLAWAILAAVAFLALRALYQALRTMNRSFLKGEEDEITFLGEEDRREKRRRKQEAKTSRFFLTPEEQIRKKYKKTLRRAIRRQQKTPTGAETPRELELLACLIPEGEQTAPGQAQNTEKRANRELRTSAAEVSPSAARVSPFTAEVSPSAAETSPSAELDVLHALYEKARYSLSGCTQEEARRAGEVKL